MGPLEVAGAFVVAISAGDTRTLGALMTPGHTFVDGDGSRSLAGRRGVRASSCVAALCESTPDGSHLRPHTGSRTGVRRLP
jgi:hypothetical protein